MMRSIEHDTPVLQVLTCNYERICMSAGLLRFIEPYPKIASRHMHLRRENDSICGDPANNHTKKSSHVRFTLEQMFPRFRKCHQSLKRELVARVTGNFVDRGIQSFNMKQQDEEIVGYLRRLSFVEKRNALTYNLLVKRYT